MPAARRRSVSLWLHGIPPAPSRAPSPRPPARLPAPMPPSRPPGRHPVRQAGFCRVWGMFAATAVRIDTDDPLSGLELGDRPEPACPDGWTTVTVKAAALNHHDVWTLRG